MNKLYLFVVLSLSTLLANSQVSFTADVTSGCTPLVVNFTNTSGVGVNYDWSFGDGSPNGNTVNASHVYNTSGSFWVYLTAYDGSWNYLGNYSMEIMPDGAPSSIGLNMDSVCPGDEIGLWVDGNGDSYNWNYGDGETFSSDWNSAQHGFSSLGNYTVSVDVQNACGTYTIDTVVTVDGNLQFTQNTYFSKSSDSVCPNDNVNFWGQNGYSSYDWNFAGDMSHTTTDNTNHAFSSFGIKPIELTITNGCGNSTTLFDTVVVSSNVQINNTPWMWVNADTTCPGSSVGFQSDQGYSSYFWDFGDGNGMNSQYADYAYPSTGNYTVSLTVENGCGNQAVVTKPIVISSNAPVLNPNIWAPDSICPGAEFNIQANADNGAAYSWDFNDGQQTTTEQNFNYTINAVGTYSVELTITNDCGVDSVLTHTIVVSNESTVSNAEFYAYENIVCPGDLVDFRVEWSYDYYLDYGDGFGTSDDNVRHAYSAVGDYPVSIIYQNACGNSVTMYDTIHVQDNLPFTGYPNFNINNPSCPNSEVDFYASNGYSSYLWDFGDGLTSTNRDVSHMYQAAGVYPVSLIITNGCGADTTLYNSAIIVNNLPITGIGWDLMADTVCPGDEIFFEADSDDGNNYEWDFGDGNTSTSFATSNAYDNVGTYTISLTATNGCGSDSTIYDSIVVGNNVIPTSSSYMAFAQEEGCLGDELYFVLVPAGAGNITWDFGDGNSTNETFVVYPSGMTAVDVAFHSYADTGQYYASYSIINGCGNTYNDSLLISVGTVGSNADVEASFWWDETQTACQGQPVEFMSVGGATYIWNFGDGSGTLVTYSSLTPIYHTYDNPGSYTITLTTYNQCGNSDTRQEDIFIPQSKVSISTNAVDDATCGEYNGLAVVSANGGMPPYTYSWSNGDNSVVADSLGSGLYVVTVTDNNGCASEGMVTLSDNEGPTILLDNIVDNDCYNDEDGSISVTVLGGVPPYTILWSNGDQTEDVFNLVAGPYEIFVTDANGCMGNASFTVSQPDQPFLSIVTGTANCGNSDGTAIATINNGVSPYNFIWPNTTGPVNTTGGLAAGVYDLMVIDANTCLIQGEFVVNEKTAPIIVLDSVITGTCTGDLSSIYINTIGGTAPFTYNWSDGSSDADLTNVQPGSYQLEVTDQNGCSSYHTETLEMELPDEVEICVVTVDTTTNTNQLVWIPSQAAGLDYYNIYKESSQSGLYYLIGSSDADSLSYYDDIYSDPTIRSWRYKVSAVDNCGNESELGENHKTLHLTANLGVGDVVNLIWDDYEGFSYSTFYINRYHPTTGWELIDSIASNLHSYTDQTPPSDSNLVYTVEITAPGLCSAQKAQDHNSTRSNRASINSDPVEEETPDAINELGLSEIHLVPNPTNGKFTLFFGGEMLNKYVTILDIQGKVVDQFELQNEDLRKDWDISHFQKGVYILKIESENNISTLKLIKQ